MGTFRHTADNIIEIDGEEFELDLFLEVEPEYTLPEECVSRYYDGEQHILRTNSTQFAGGKTNQKNQKESTDIHTRIH